MTSYIPSNDPHSKHSQSHDPLLRDSIDLLDEEELVEKSPRNSSRYYENVQQSTRRSRRQLCGTIALSLWFLLTTIAAIQVTVSKNWFEHTGKRMDVGGEWSGNVPYFPKQLKKFQHQHGYALNPLNATTTKESLLFTKWQALMPEGKGLISPFKEDTIPTLPDGIWSPSASEYLWEISVFHQLGCLYKIMQSHNMLATNRTHHESHTHHESVRHCFDYLRQSIMCTSDTALEGRSPHKHPGGQHDEGTQHHDEGQQHGREDVMDGNGSRHICRDYEAVKAWAEGARREKGKIVHDEGMQHGHDEGEQHGHL